MSEIHGEVTPGFEGVKDAFANNFDQHADVGAAFSVYYRGEKVVDLWGGLADTETNKPWAQDSLQLIFSSTKGATALMANLLAQRGELDVDAPVAKYWPEFAAAGKENIPVRYLLSHQVGLPHIPPLTLEESYTWEAPIKRLEAQSPAWEPGTKHGYHPGTFGWLVGEVIHRITGKTPGTFMAEEVSGPLGLDFWIGLPESEEHRMTTVQSVDPRVDPLDESTLNEAQRNMIATAQIPDSLLALSMSVLPPETDPNSRAFHASEQPAGSGITDARSLARMYASLIGDGVDGIRLLNDETMRRATTEQTSGIDAVMALPTRFGLGFALNVPIAVGFPEYSSLAGAMGNEGAFGHNGAGGSLGFADPTTGFSFGYVMNQMHMVTVGDDPRTLSLIKAVHQAIS
jgi:CubicO group peptidase (beta-lactamase class C family)